MSHQISRRLFLKGGLAAAGTLAASSIPAAASITDGTGHLATLLDISKCIACGACVEACSETNQSKYPEPEKPFPKMVPSRAKNVDWSEKRDVDDRLTPYNWLYIQSTYVEHDGEEHEVNIPRRCMHCTNPPCVKLCPFGAAEQLKNGIALINDNLCLGGAKCKTVCPWKIPERQSGLGIYLDILPKFAGNGVMYKCDRCYDRIAQGEQPACIEACPEDVQTIGPRDDIIRQAHALAKEMNGYIYGENENGGTNTIYVSPVPFDKLNKAIEKGKGKPHLKPVKDHMADGNNLAAALAIAPIAGIAAAVGKFYKMTK
ncbi:MAG: 4Fe-4S dicluster domain-containing protein [Deltaproteobacteria bacterium]|nr:4Fe-4S dicluster domain-containing protein [Deltaproteobacteria bacterium]MBW2176807.1 4Fe-4S dicluster domain-containing protein [Deltaproteobacteria bacterium]